MIVAGNDVAAQGHVKDRLLVSRSFLELLLGREGQHEPRLLAELDAVDREGGGAADL